MSLSRDEIKFLTNTLKTVISKMGNENPVRKILRKQAPRKPSVSKEANFASRLVFFNGQNPPTDYGRYKSPMGG